MVGRQSMYHSRRISIPSHIASNSKIRTWQKWNWEKRILWLADTQKEVLEYVKNEGEEQIILRLEYKQQQE